MTKLAVITGCSTGIGRAAALHLAGQGFRVLAGVRKEKDADSFRASPGITPVIIDVTDDKTVKSAAAHPALSEAGQVHLINNAGVAMGGPVEATPVNKWKQQFDVNVFGLVEVTQAFLPFIRATKGRIVNLSSVAGIAASPYLGPYAASKFAVEAISDSLRRELKQFGVKVIVLEPGPIKTPIWEKGMAVQDSSSVSGEMESLYGKEMKLFRALVKKSEEEAVDVSKISALLENVLTCASPRTRYVVGARGLALQMKIARLLPDTWLDSAIAKELGTGI
jgi:NAD(P)-dependent dehydrogenase (short-subunit alcohol dehydrogenase family)